MAVTALLILLLGTGLPAALNPFVQHMMRESMSGQSTLPIVRDSLSQGMLGLVLGVINLGFSLLRALSYGMLPAVLVQVLSTQPAKVQEPVT